MTCSKGVLLRYRQHIVADMCDIDKDPNSILQLSTFDAHLPYILAHSVVSLYGQLDAVLNCHSLLKQCM